MGRLVGVFSCEWCLALGELQCAGCVYVGD